MTGRRTKPLAMPKTTMPNHILKKTIKMYDLAAERIITAMKVEAPPWITLDPILLTATLALYNLFSDFTVIYLGTGVMR